mgnify:CR=1 FL=1
MRAVGVRGGAWLGGVNAWGDVFVDGQERLRWFVAADDRWYRPSRETTVRQREISGVPVIETRIKVPGGDAVQRVYGVADFGGAIVVEVFNDSSLPFAVAFDRGDIAAMREPSPTGVQGIDLPAGSVVFPVGHHATMRVAILVADIERKISAQELESLPSFEQVFRNLNQEITAPNQESMWEIPFNETRGRVIFDLGVNHAKADKYTGQNRGGTVIANPAMWYEYEKEDTRRAVSITPYGWDSDGTQNTAFQVASTLGKMYLGKYRYEWMTRRVTSANDDGVNWIYMRYSDVILMAAEAINKLDGPAAAAPYLRQIRDRAYPNNPGMVTAYMNTVTASPEAFQNAIVKERNLEFVGEMLRKNDLIRWNLLDAKLAENKAKLQQLESRTGMYANLPTRIYYTLNGENLTIYGLNFGDTDAAGAASGYAANKTWTMSGSSDVVTFWDALYVNQPSKQPYWPIWQTFLDSSNGTLNNSFLGL